MMERRILKDFQIGIVEGIINESLQTAKEPKDVFSTIAKVIGKRSSSKMWVSSRAKKFLSNNFNFLTSKKEDWNEKVRKSTIHRNPIGSTSEALQRQRSRQSLRRTIMENSDIAMNTESLVEFNPKLADVSHTTRVAYAKFMTTKLKKEIKFEDEKVQYENEKERERGSKALTKFKMNAGILKKRQEAKVEVEVEAVPVASTSSADDDTMKNFRSRTPIPEDPNEGLQTPDRPSTPENILDEPVPQMSSSPLPTISPSPVPQAVSSPSPSSSPTEPNPKTASESKKPDSPMVKSRSMSITSEASVKSTEPPPTIKTPDLLKADEEDEDEEDDEEKPEKASKDSTHLNVPGSSSRPVSPSFSMTGDKGKSKITGKTLTGWI